MSDSQTNRPHTAGVFDIRVIIGTLLGAYGVLLVLLGLFHDTAREMARSDGLNINLWGGLGMVVASAVFVLWARARPVKVPEPATDEGA